jgi:hypothetical protein
MDIHFYITKVFTSASNSVINMLSVDRHPQPLDTGNLTFIYSSKATEICPCPLYSKAIGKLQAKLRNLPSPKESCTEIGSSPRAQTLREACNLALP